MRPLFITSWIMGYLIVNLRYQLFIYNCFTAKFQFPMHIPEQLYDIKALIWPQNVAFSNSQSFQGSQFSCCRFMPVFPKHWEEGREKGLDFRRSLLPTDSDRCWVGSSKCYQKACQKMIPTVGFITKHLRIHWNILKTTFLWFPFVWYKAWFTGASKQAEKQSPTSQYKRRESNNLFS